MIDTSLQTAKPSQVLSIFGSFLKCNEALVTNRFIFMFVLCHTKYLSKTLLSYFYLFTGGYIGKDGSKVTTVVATPGQGPDRPQEVSYTDTKVIGNGSFGVVYQAKLCETNEFVAIKKVLQDKRFKVSFLNTSLITLKYKVFFCFLEPRTSNYEEIRTL